MSAGLPSRRVLVLRRAWRGFLRRRGYDDAAALTFFAALTVLPGALLLVAATVLLDGRGRAVDDLSAIAGTFIPSADTALVRDALRELLAFDHPGLALLVGLALTIWTVSGYAAAYGRAVDSLFDSIDGRRWPLFRAEMLAVAVLVVVLGAGIATILLLTPTASGDILQRRGVDPVAETLWNIGKWPLLLVLLVVFVGLLERFAPNIRLPRLRWLTLGSGIAILVWAVLTGAFGAYIALTGAYGHVYGRLGILLAALLWAYLSNLALLIGVQFDAELLRMRQLGEGIAAERTVVVELADTRRTLRIARQEAQDVADATRIRDAARARIGDGAVSPEAPGR